MEIVFDIIGEIFELLSLVDIQTKYLMVFTAIWFHVLIICTVVVKKRKKEFFLILAFIPVINFAVFYLFNFTKGAPLLGFLRYGAHLAVSIV